MALTMRLAMIFSMIRLPFGAGLVCDHLYPDFIHGSMIDEWIFYPRIENYFFIFQKIHGKVDGKKKISFRKHSNRILFVESEVEMDLRKRNRFFTK